MSAPPPLTRQLANRLLKRQGASVPDRPWPERVLQIGTGNFLRAFAGWMVERMNRRGLFRGSIVVAQATPHSRATALLNAQDGCYTVLERGIVDGAPREETELVTSVTRALNPFTNLLALLACAERRELRFVISNTTEAGIAYRPCGPETWAASGSFPALMTRVLHHRFVYAQGARDAGLVFLPCELIERNGHTLRDIVLRHAADWELGEAFAGWVRSACVFANTLVDRIVPGYPADQAGLLATQLGYVDRLLVVAEVYHQWVIEASREVAVEFPAAEAGLNIVWTDDLEPYRTRKVRILNGAHTLLAPAAFLVGLETVRQAVEDPLYGAYLRRALFDEIVPSLVLPEGEASRFAEDTFARFRNPAICHRLESILLNCTSKWKVRVLPSLQAGLARAGDVPRLLAFSLAALIALYRVREQGCAWEGRGGAGPYTLQDAPETLRLFGEAWALYDQPDGAEGLARRVLSDARLWGEPLDRMQELVSLVATDLRRIVKQGIQPALRRALEE